MKVGTLMDPYEARRGTRTRGFFFDPHAVELVEISTDETEEAVDDDDEQVGRRGYRPPNEEPEPDDPDADKEQA